MQLSTGCVQQWVKHVMHWCLNTNQLIEKSDPSDFWSTGLLFEHCLLLHHLDFFFVKVYQTQVLTTDFSLTFSVRILCHHTTFLQHKFQVEQDDPSRISSWSSGSIQYAPYTHRSGWRRIQAQMGYQWQHHASCEYQPVCLHWWSDSNY